MFLFNSKNNVILLHCYNYYVLNNYLFKLPLIYSQAGFHKIFQI